MTDKPRAAGACGKCHTCGTALRFVLDGEEWCPTCGAYRRYRSHGWAGPDAEQSPCPQSSAVPARKVKVRATWKTPRSEVLAACAAVIRDFDIPREEWDEECEAMAGLALERVMFSYYGRPDAAAARETMARIKARFIRDLRSLLDTCPRCNGTGVIELPARYGAWVISDTAACPQCTPQTEDEPPF